MDARYRSIRKDDFALFASADSDDIAEAYRILAPGGRVAFVETDDMIGARRGPRIRPRNSAAQFGRAQFGRAKQFCGAIL